jgi:hypothetical protein
MSVCIVGVGRASACGTGSGEGDLLVYFLNVTSRTSGKTADDR